MKNKKNYCILFKYKVVNKNIIINKNINIFIYLFFAQINNKNKFIFK